MMKPMIKYRGGKSKEIPYIINFIPRFSGRYIEPFFGGGALFFYLEPHKSIINDINEKLMLFYNGVRDNYPELKRELSELEQIYMLHRREYKEEKRKHPDCKVEDKNEEFYYHLRAQFNGLEPKNYSDAALYFFINKTAYSGMIRYNSNGEFNVPFGRYPHLNTSAVTPSHNILLQRTEIFNKDYSEIFAMCDENDFIFLDPPYDCTFSDYGNKEYRDGFNAEEHRRLAEAFYNLPCKALMIIGKTPLIEELYHNNILAEYDKSYAVNIRNRFKSEATHIIVANYQKDYDNAVNAQEYRIAEVAQPLLFETKTEYGKN